MPTGRSGIAFDDILAKNVTVFADNSTITLANAATVVGRAVAISADDTVKLAADADPVFGKLLKVEADLGCTVQVRGFCTLGGGTAATLTRGRRAIGALNGGNPGFIRVVNTAAAAELNGVGPIMVNVGDANNVLVDFG